MVIAKRLSGSYLERFLVLALPIPLLLALYTLYKNGIDQDTGEAAFIILAFAFLVWVVDCEPARRRQPVSLIDGDILLIGDDAVAPSSISSITPLRRYRTAITNLVEISYDLGETRKTAVVLSKPDFFPLNLVLKPRTLRALIKSHPELKQRGRLERVI